MSRRTWVSGTPRTPPRGVAIRATRTTPRATQATCTTNGQTMPAAKRNAPSGGPTSWLAVRKPACRRALPMPRSALSTSIGSSVPGRRVGEHLGHAVDEHRRQHEPDRHLPGHDGHAQHGDDDRPQEVGHDDHPTPVEPVGDRPGPQPEQQPGEPLQHGGQGHQHGVAGLRGHQQGAGGQGDPVADVADPRRREQPPEAAPQPWRRDDVQNPAHETGEPTRRSGGFLDHRREHVRWSAVHVCSHAQT